MIHSDDIFQINVIVCNISVLLQTVGSAEGQSHDELRKIEQSSSILQRRKHFSKSTFLFRYLKLGSNLDSIVMCLEFKFH